MKQYLLASAALLVGMGAAHADYYVVQESNTKECKIVETVPEDKVWIQVGPVAFATREEADKEVAVLCKDNPKVKVIEKK